MDIIAPIILKIIRNIVAITKGARKRMEPNIPVKNPMIIPTTIESLILSGLLNKITMHMALRMYTHSGFNGDISFKANVVVAINIELTIILIQAEVSNFIFSQYRLYFHNIYSFKAVFIS